MYIRIMIMQPLTINNKFILMQSLQTIAQRRKVANESTAGRWVVCVCMLRG